MSSSAEVRRTLFTVQSAESDVQDVAGAVVVPVPHTVADFISAKPVDDQAHLSFLVRPLILSVHELFAIAFLAFETLFARVVLVDQSDDVSVLNKEFPQTFTLRRFFVTIA